MFNRISSFTLSILLFLVLLGSAANFYVFAASLLVLIAATLAINIKRLGWSWPHLLLPCFFLLGTGSVFAVITSPTIRIVFLVIATILFFAIENQLGRESHFLQNIYLLSVFAIFVGLFAAQFYFDLSVFWLVLSVFVFSYLLIIQGFAGFTLPAKRYFTFLIALVCAQVAWGLHLWPTYYVVNAVVLFCVFYILWLFSFSAFFGKLNKQKIYWQLTLITIVLTVTLTSAAWRPLFN